MELKFTPKTINKIDVNDFNTFVESKYGGSFEFEAIHEANNALYEFTAPNMAMFFDNDVDKINSMSLQTPETY